MPRILPLRADRPLRHAADDLLGFDRIAEGLASQVLATRDCGLVAAVRAPLGGAGRTSLLNLLHGALLARGLPVLRLAGPCDARVLRDLAPLHAAAPILLVDDADPAQWRDAACEAIVIAAWSLDAGDRGAEISPLVIDVPRWSEEATAALAARLGGDAEPAWRELLATASTPREAWRLVAAASAALARGDGDECRVLHALSGAPADARELIPGEAPAHDDHDEPARQRCAVLARQADAAAAAELESMLADERAAVRVAAIQAFAHLAPSLALAPVRPLLAHADAASRRAAAHVLGRLDDQLSFDAIAALVADPSADVRRAATAALARLGGPRAIDVLLPALADANAGLRMASDTALCQLLDEIGADGSEPPLRELVASLAAVIASRHETARGRATAALERLGLGSAADALAALLRSSVEREREVASSALACCAGAIAAIGALLEEPDEDVARRAADLLGRLGDAHAVPALLEAHARAAPSVRQAAAASLVRLGFGG